MSQTAQNIKFVNFDGVGASYPIITREMVNHFKTLHRVPKGEDATNYPNHYEILTIDGKRRCFKIKCKMSDSDNAFGGPSSLPDSYDIAAIIVSHNQDIKLPLFDFITSPTNNAPDWLKIGRPIKLSRERIEVAQDIAGVLVPELFQIKININYKSNNEEHSRQYGPILVNYTTRETMVNTTHPCMPPPPKQIKIENGQSSVKTEQNNNSNNNSNSTKKKKAKRDKLQWARMQTHKVARVMFKDIEGLYFVLTKYEKNYAYKQRKNGCLEGTDGISVGFFDCSYYDVTRRNEMCLQISRFGEISMQFYYDHTQSTQQHQIQSISIDTFYETKKKQDKKQKQAICKEPNHGFLPIYHIDTGLNGNNAVTTNGNSNNNHNGMNNASNIFNIGNNNSGININNNNNYNTSINNGNNMIIGTTNSINNINHCNNGNSNHNHNGYHSSSSASHSPTLSNSNSNSMSNDISMSGMGSNRSAEFRLSDRNSFGPCQPMPPMAPTSSMPQIQSLPTLTPMPSFPPFPSLQTLQLPSNPSLNVNIANNATNVSDVNNNNNQVILPRTCNIGNDYYDHNHNHNQNHNSNNCNINYNINGTSTGSYGPTRGSDLTQNLANDRFAPYNYNNTLPSRPHIATQSRDVTNPSFRAPIPPMQGTHEQQAQQLQIPSMSPTQAINLQEQHQQQHSWQQVSNPNNIPPAMSVNMHNANSSNFDNDNGSNVGNINDINGNLNNSNSSGITNDYDINSMNRIDDAFSFISSVNDNLGLSMGNMGSWNFKGSNSVISGISPLKLRSPSPSFTVFNNQH